MLEENVVSSAGAKHRSNRDELIHLIRTAGRVPAQRDTLYHHLVVHDDPANDPVDDRVASHFSSTASSCTVDVPARRPSRLVEASCGNARVPDRGRAGLRHDVRRTASVVDQRPGVTRSTASRSPTAPCSSTATASWRSARAASWSPGTPARGSAHGPAS